MNAAHAPHILILKIRGVGVAYNLDGNIVFTGMDILGYIKFGIVVSSLAVAYALAVNIQVYA